jgi:hypothetical protein
MTTKTFLTSTTTSYIIWGRTVHGEVTQKYTQQLGFMMLTSQFNHRSTLILVDFLSSKQVDQRALAIPLIQCGISCNMATIISTASNHPRILHTHLSKKWTWIVTKPMCEMHWTTTKTILPSLLFCPILMAPPFLPTTSTQFGQPLA